LKELNENPESLFVVIFVFSKIIFTHFIVYVGNHVYNLAVYVDSQSVSILSNL